ncbi:hypothetical protein ACFL54_05200 [Planctomycetota bacterium]
MDDRHNISGNADWDRRRIFWIVFIVTISFMAYGLFQGNVFETYHNGSTL